MSLTNRGLVRFDEYQIDRAQWQLTWRAQPIPLNRKTLDLLLYLVDHRERVVVKDELLQALWPEQFIEESNLTQHVFLLRKALSRHSSGQKMIETVPGRGYRFTTPVTEREPSSGQLTINASESITRITIEEEQETSTPHAVFPSSRPVTRAARTTLVISPLVAILVAAGWIVRQHWLDQTGGPPIDVVLTSMDGTTGDSVLDRGLISSLRIDIGQSPVVSIVPAATVRDTLIQMMRKPDDIVTTAIAREICERTNSQAVIHSTIARVGQHFLLTEEASNCVDGKVLAEAKQEAAHLEDLPHSIDQLAETLRQKLGESRRSIARFNMPLSQIGNTSSLDALKAYTQGSEELGRGHTANAIAFFKTAVANDPSFALAQYGLVACYSTEGDDLDARTAAERAYRMRATASRPVQFLVTAAHIRWNTQDLYESLRNDQNWTALYPNFPQAWDRLSTVERDLAQYPGAVASSKRAVALQPLVMAYDTNLATGQIQSGALKDARATLEQALAHKIDSDSLRTRYLELSYVLHDVSLQRQQYAWAEAHPDAATVVLAEARIAIAEGRFSDAQKLVARNREICQQQGVGAAGEQNTKSEAVDLMEAGAIKAGKKMFLSVPVDQDEGLDAIGLVYAGDIPAAKAALHAMQTKYPHGTLWNLYWGPQILASIAMVDQKPRDAAAILETARPIEMRELVIPWLRGTAYLAAGEPDRAEKDFREVLAHPEADPTSPDISLSWLGLARALTAQDKRPAATDAYQHFFTLWAHADPDAIYLNQAKVEFAKLQGAPPAI